MPTEPVLPSVTADGRLREMPPDPNEPKGASSEPRLFDITSLTVAAQLPEYLELMKNGRKRLPTGWTLVDQTLHDGGRDEHGNPLSGGFVIPSVVILGAQPKAGKSTFAQITAEHIAEHGGWVYYLDIENGRRRFFERLLCRRAKVGPGYRTSEEQERFEAAAAEWYALGGPGSRFLLDTDRALTPLDISERVRALRRIAGDAPVFVVLDSLQKLHVADLGDRRSGTDSWLREIEALRNDPEICPVILVICELKRTPNGRYEPTISAFKESGDIEYTGDLLLSMTVDAGNDDDLAPRPGDPTAHAWTDTRDSQPATLRIIADRDGSFGRVAEYQTIFPFHGMRESEPAPVTKEAKDAGIRKGTTTRESSPRARQQELGVGFEGEQ